MLPRYIYTNPTKSLYHILMQEYHLIELEKEMATEERGNKRKQHEVNPKQIVTNVASDRIIEETEGQGCNQKQK